MALFDRTKLHGYPPCSFGVAKRNAEDDERNSGVLIVTMILVVCIVLFIAGIVARRIWKTPKTPKNDDVELAVVAQPVAAEPAVPAPVANPERRRSITPAPPPYHATSANLSKDSA